MKKCDKPTVIFFNIIIKYYERYRCATLANFWQCTGCIFGHLKSQRQRCNLPNLQLDAAASAAVVAFSVASSAVRVGGVLREIEGDEMLRGRSHRQKVNFCSKSSSCSSVAPHLHNLIECDVGQQEKNEGCRLGTSIPPNH